MASAAFRLTSGPDFVAGAVLLKHLSIFAEVSQKRSFWKSGASVFEEVSHKTLVLEVRIFSFRGSLAQNARFGAPDLQF